MTQQESLNTDNKQSWKDMVPGRTENELPYLQQSASCNRYKVFNEASAHTMIV